MNAETIAKALGGRRAGGCWMAPCPAHPDRAPSLSIRDTDNGKVCVHCHAGCDQERLITTLRAHGLWMEDGPRSFSRPAPRTVAKRQPDKDDIKRSEAALSIWQLATPANGTLVETYLASRGLLLPPPQTLRFHTGLKHRSGSTWPAMAHGSDNTPVATHRTFIARDGRGKAPVNPSKMMLGPCRGGAVRLAAPGDVLMLGEGIETCLAAMLATGYPSWPALSASGLRALDLPDDVRHVIVLADGDDACADRFPPAPLWGGPR